jgi:hypothetical protein
MASTAVAHWTLGDDYKMHFPQLPNPNGWDISATTIQNPTGENNIIADDWQCSGTGPVTDIHFWGSWKQDVVGVIQNIHLSIHEDLQPDIDYYYSRPGEELWSLDTTDFTISESLYGTQGWYDPVDYAVSYPDHQQFYQYNVTNVPQPFVQQEGTIYWLDITVTVAPEQIQPEFGWKTTSSNYQDAAVYFSYYYDENEEYIPLGWFPLYDPYNYESLDMAFVITPEPTTICLLGFGAFIFLKEKRSKRYPT